SLPYPDQSQRRPHTPRAEAPQIEIISIANFPRHGVAELGRLRPSVLEIHVVDECERHHHHQRAEVRERSPVASPVDVAAESAEEKEEEGEAVLDRGVYAGRIAQPLPPEIGPPHSHL